MNAAPVAHGEVEPQVAEPRVAKPGTAESRTAESRVAGPRVPPPRVVVIGGGITGLTAAYRLLHPVSPTATVPEVVLLESGDRLGGKIRTTPFGGRSVDEGADAFLLRVPWASDLCDELGISSERISPAVTGASVVHRGRRGIRVSPLPGGLVAGVPTRLAPLARSALLGPVAVLRASMDYLLARRRGNSARHAPQADHSDDDGDASLRHPSIGDIIRDRLGPAVATQVVDPLLGSISAGHIDRIDAQTSAPQLAQALGRSRSLMRGLRALQPAAARNAGSAAPIFASFPSGMGHLVDTLRERIDSCDIRLGTPVHAVRPTRVECEPPDGGQVAAASQESLRPLTVETSAGLLDADAVIVAVPAFAAAQMLAAVPSAASALARIEYASVAVVTLAVRTADQRAASKPAEAGFLVSRNTGLLMTACSYGSAKWPQWSGDSSSECAGHHGALDNDESPNHDGFDHDSLVLRISVGRDDDDRHTKMTEVELRDAVVAELASLPGLRNLANLDGRTAEAAEAVGAADAIVDWRVSRWDRGLPQYRPGHGELIDGIDSALAAGLPGVVVAGAACHGLGIPACIRDGDAAAKAVLEAAESVEAADVVEQLRTARADAGQ